jgi:hypothetical protein
MRRDEAARIVASAATLETRNDWRGAMSAYTDALTNLPLTDRDARWSLRLARAKARMQTGELVEAMFEMDALLVELQRADPTCSQIQDIRANLATAEYYAGWLMRLEGAPDDAWMAEIQSAREQFQKLTREKSSSPSSDTKEYQQNFEATIRLARMELNELRQMPLPAFLRACKSISGPCRSRRLSKASHSPP